MPLQPGTTLGPYAVTAKIGEGGMGEVYRARDTRLDRDVALKVLPQAFTDDPDRLARFEREAKVLASLNHPNIGHIYGLEEAEGQKALVLELVEGPTLADRIVQGPVPLDEALTIARQISEALEAAHEQGIVHRDLKPANIKVRADSTVKVLDFGLAKALDTTPEGDPSQSPTLTAMASQAGVVMGTAAYMSPEQARGETVDRRADIWAFGVVVYEMLTGRRPFEGRTVSDTLASILARDPDLDALPTNIPRAVHRLLRRCFEKEPKKRLRDIAEGVLQLDDGLEAPAEELNALAPATPQLQLWQRPLPAILAALSLVVLTGLGVWSAVRPTPSVPRVERFAIPPPAPETMRVSAGRRDIAISPDGSKVVYSSGGGSQSQLYVRGVDSLTATPLQGLGRPISPFVSPNSAWVGFLDFSDATLKKVSILGGPAIPIYSIVAGERTLGVDWAEDDTVIFGTTTPSGLWRVSANGGEPEKLTTPDTEPDEANHGWPQVLPGGRTVLFTILTGEAIETAQIALLDFDSGEYRVLVSGGSAPRYSSTGHIVYGVGGTLRAVGFDLGRLEVTDPSPVPVLDGVITKESGAANFDIARDGSLVYVVGAAVTVQQRALVWVDREGREEPLATPMLPYQRPRVSPDGGRVAVDVADPEGADIWIHDLTRGTETRLTTDPADDRAPLWTLDGERVVFASNREGQEALFWKLVDRPGDAERLMSPSERRATIEASAWSANGQTLLFWASGAGTSLDTGLLSMEGERASELLFETEFREGGPAISPDGGWIAYHTDETGQDEVYVQRYPELGSRQTISTDGGQQPLWSPDGQELFYRNGDEMMVVPVAAGATFRAGDPEVLFEQQYYLDRSRRTYDLAPDGRFLMVKESAVGDDTESPTAQIILVQNWHEELKRLVPIP